MEKTFKVKGLDCQNCANKLELELSKQAYIESVSVDMMQQSIVITFKDGMLSKGYEKAVAKLIVEIEPDVMIIDEDLTQSNFRGNRQLFIRICISVFLLFLAVVLKNNPVEIFLYIFAYFIAGYDILLKAVKKIFRKDMFDENFLMSIATIGALMIEQYPEAVLVIVLYQIGEYLQSLAVARSRQSITALMDINVKTAHLLTKETIVDINVENVQVGDIILCYPGEKIAVDGEVVKGTSTLDLSKLTGESNPLQVTVNSRVLSGCINLTETIQIRAIKRFEDSTASQILQLVSQASAKKSSSERFITRFARIYTPIVVLLALIVATVVPFVLNQDYGEWIYRALVFLVISCPCALVLSVPVTFYAGLNGAAKKGVLIKGSDFLEGLSHLEQIIFDKTGTLTQEDFSVVEIICYNDYSKESVLRYAAYANAQSLHPIARSIIKAYAKPLDDKKISIFKSLAGKGSYAIIENQHVYVGSEQLLRDMKIEIPEISLDGNVIFVVVDEMLIGKIVIKNSVREEALQVIKALKALGIEQIAMLTGDNIQVANEVAKQLEITNVYAQLLPQDKVLIFEKIQKDKFSAFVGDGINDAPVLMRADIGVAMGNVGQDAAIEAADVILMSDNLMQLVDAIKLSKKTNKIVRQNIVFALGFKVFILLLSLFGITSMWLAIFADVGISILATLNALRATK